MKIKKGDIIFIIVALLVGLGVMLYLYLAPKTEGGFVKVYLDSYEYAALPLNVNDTLTIENGNKKNIISIENGTAIMTFANCPDLVCTNHKPIKFTNETIVCLPHKIVLEIVGGQEGDVDVYTYKDY